jgi:prepilin-type N-terminal cleavage/methylation domain-containing protein
MLSATSKHRRALRLGDPPLSVAVAVWPTENHPLRTQSPNGPILVPLHPRAFTLLEMLIATAILLIAIAAIALLFQSTSRAVGTSQALLEMLSNVRAIQDQMTRDVASLDKNGFLIIRSRATPNGHRVDQVAFLALGSSTSPQEPHVTANAAHIWWGQLTLANDVTPADQSMPLPLNALPAGDTLGRHITLLLAPATPGQYADPTIPCFPDIAFTTPALSFSANEPPAHITASRIGSAAFTPSQIMATLRTAPIDPATYCYRFRSLPSVYGSQISIANAATRMTAIALQGVDDFQVEWTPAGANGQTSWYGLTNPQSATPTLNEPLPAHDDAYVACFSFDTPRAQWPTALRITFHVTDANHRLPGGRTFVQLLKLPD